MANEEYIIKPRIDDSGVQSGMKSVSDKSIAALKGIGLAAAGLFAADKIKEFFKNSTREAIMAEEAVRRFNFALKAQGIFTEELSESYQRYADRLEKATGTSAESILEGTQMLMQIGGLGGKALNEATLAALNLSARMGGDVNQAFMSLTKASNGMVREFSQMGIEFRKGASDAENFQKIVKYINTEFNNAAQDQLTSYAGKVKLLEIAWGDFQKFFGESIIQSSTMSDIIDLITSGLNALITALKYLKEGFFQLGLYVEWFGNVLVAVAKGMDMTVLSTDVMAKGINEATKKFWTLVQANHDYIFGTQAVNAANDAVVLGNNRVRQSIQEISEELLDLREQQRLYEIHMYQTEKQQKDFFAGFNEGVKSMAMSVRDLGKTTASVFVNGMTNAFASMGKALVNGGNAFSEFGKQALSTMGSLAIMMGQFLVLAGLGLSALPWEFSAAQAIAAGIGLTILGGVLQALGGGGSTPATTGVGSTSTGGTTNNPLENPVTDEERVAPQTGVQVVVQGNILDRRETGLAIAEIINESFNTNGVFIRA